MFCDVLVGGSPRVKLLNLFQCESSIFFAQETVHVHHIIPFIIFAGVHDAHAFWLPMCVWFFFNVFVCFPDIL